MTKYERNQEKNTYSWVYTGGCFKDNKPALYVPASPYERISFQDTQFEVRQDFRNIEDIKSSNSNSNLNQYSEDSDEETTEEFNDDEEKQQSSSENISEKKKKDK